MRNRFIHLLLHSALLSVVFTDQSMGHDLPRSVTDEDYAEIDLDEAKLGQLLFYDSILSGNKNIACATCHHPDLGTSDGVSLSIGEGGIGLGPERRVDENNVPEQSVPRNSPALFNLGAREFTVMFHDGRLEADTAFSSGIRSPLDEDMMEGFASVLSAQTMFPVLSRDEMAGSYDENEIGRAVRQGRITGEGGAWDMLAQRVAAIPEYADSFEEVYAHIEAPSDIRFTDISNAIAAFIAWEWRSDTSPFDALLRGEFTFKGNTQAGLELFYGKADCVSCHSGPFLTDHSFHAVGAPQIGPGKSATFETHYRDDGRFRVTGRAEDRFAFRTPSLRNVALTAPYGHAGAHKDLAAFITAHADPVIGLENYDASQAIIVQPDATDHAILQDPQERSDIIQSISVEPVALNSDEVEAIEAFLQTLTDPVAKSGRLGIPSAVPSGLPVP